MAGSSLTVLPNRFNSFGRTEIDGIRVAYPARWGDGEGAIVYLEDSNGGLHQLNLSNDLVAELIDELSL
jgi:hypothetical protein